MSVFKEKIIAGCKSVLEEKNRSLTGDLESINDSISRETKSSAGDKHETARARMQFEQEKLVSAIEDVKCMISALGNIRPLESSEAIFTGSVVETNQGIFFIAVPIGKITVDGREVFVISPQSPVGKVLMGLRAHDTFTLNDRIYSVESYY
jgi:transcription elongation GreA/GreB family factor